MHEQVYKTTNIYNKLHMILYMFKLQEEKLRKRFHKILEFEMQENCKMQFKNLWYKL